MQHLRRTGDQQFETQRWQAQQAQREQAALNGELGQAAQIIALSEVYAALRRDGKLEQAAEIKRRVNLIVTEGK